MRQTVDSLRHQVWHLAHPFCQPPANSRFTWLENYKVEATHTHTWHRLCWEGWLQFKCLHNRKLQEDLTPFTKLNISFWGKKVIGTALKKGTFSERRDVGHKRVKDNEVDTLPAAQTPTLATHMAAHVSRFKEAGRQKKNALRVNKIKS